MEDLDDPWKFGVLEELKDIGDPRHTRNLGDVRYREIWETCRA